jgi:hypothetical protein
MTNTEREREPDEPTDEDYTPKQPDQLEQDVVDDDTVMGADDA